MRPVGRRPRRRKTATNSPFSTKHVMMRNIFLRDWGAPPLFIDWYVVCRKEQNSTAPISEFIFFCFRRPRHDRCAKKYFRRLFALLLSRRCRQTKNTMSMALWRTNTHSDTRTRLHKRRNTCVPRATARMLPCGCSLPVARNTTVAILTSFSSPNLLDWNGYCSEIKHVNYRR